MRENHALFASDEKTTFVAASACCCADAGEHSKDSGAHCNAGDMATIYDVAAHLAHMDATLQLLAKNE